MKSLFSLIGLFVIFNVAESQTKVHSGYSVIFPNHKIFAFESEKSKQQYLKLVKEQKKKQKETGKILPELSVLGIGGTDAYDYTDEYIGFVGALDTSKYTTIISASQISPDTGLHRIIVRLDQLRVWDYPGWGTHTISVTFKAINGTTVANPGDQSQESIAFVEQFKANDQSGAGVTGLPIFNGLNVASTGAGFAFSTTNVNSSGDEDVLKFLGSDEIQNGVKLLSTAQPAIQALSTTALGLGKGLLENTSNRVIQDEQLGLDYEQSGSSVRGARLAEGSYIVIEGPGIFHWSDWVYDKDAEVVVDRTNHNPIPLNYLVFRVNKYKGN